MSDTKPACWSCRFFDRDQTSDEDGGFCRRYPPRGVSREVVILPGVDYMDWCGEFRPQGDGEDA